MLEFRPVKSGRGGIGGSGKKNAKKWPSRSKLRQVSPKQRKRTEDLKDKLEVLLAKQHEIYGTERCEMGFALGEKCPEDSPFVVDHVGTRNQSDADRFGNLQVLCIFHNGIKGSKRIDFRPHRMKLELEELDEQN